VPAEGSAHVTVFDVGQGLAVAVQTHSHTLLYDTGPDYSGDADSGSRILLPALRGMGIRQLDTLVLSHDDVDHIGGTESVLQGLAVTNVISPLPATHPRLQLAARKEACADGQAWDWDGVRFEILHPAANDAANPREHDNERSCVLRVSTGSHSVLLVADIEKLSEQRLLRLHADQLPATLLVAPHHGSNSSSAQAFVDAVHPLHVVFTAGYRNRFGHPAQNVVDRYRAAGSELLRSDEDGAISIEMDAQTFRLERYRKSHARYWQHAAGSTGAP
jgi:competence protein ComEC